MSLLYDFFLQSQETETEAETVANAVYWHKLPLFMVSVSTIEDEEPESVANAVYWQKLPFFTVAVDEE